MTQEEITHEKVLKAVEEMKAAYIVAFKNDTVLNDLFNFCRIEPINCLKSDGSVDTSKLAINAGRASVLERIQYFLTTPSQQIVKDYQNKIGETIK